MNARLLASSVAFLLIIATACERSEADAIRIGVLADCEGYGAAFYDVALAGAELPLIELGGRVEEDGLRDGMTGIAVDGHPVELLFGCAGDTVGEVMETRRLVEVEGVDVLIGPNIFPETYALLDYSARHPHTAFLIATMEHTSGMNLGPNVFRFTADSVQMAAGLGGYAFHDLGWRSAASVTFPDSMEWGMQAGFLGEFCSLGGDVADRYWLDVVPEDYSAKIAKIPMVGPDGFFLATDAAGAAKFLKRYAKQQPRLAQHVVSAAYGTLPVLLDPPILDPLGDRLLGMVTATFVPQDQSQPGWEAYVDKFGAEFPALAKTAASASHTFDIDYFNAMKAVVSALESVHGDLSDGAGRFMQNLARVRLDAPNGHIELDDQRQAIVPIYLSRLEKDGRGNLVWHTFRRIDGVDQTLGGAVNVDESDIDRTQPTCRSGNPPPWATAT